MTNGTIPEKDKSILKEIVALLLVLLGACALVVGIGRAFGVNGILIIGGLVLLFVGIKLGLAQTGKD
jgi:protein-S-isoprenylcysteine O-methyltransferase Ste14